MIGSEVLARINELARKKRSVGLTDEEALEQRQLYEIYLLSIRGQVINLLDSIEFVDDPDKTPPPNSKKKKVLHQTTVNLEQILH